MTITKKELEQLLGGAVPVGVQAVFTVQEPDETFRVCERHDANHVTLYLRLENGEVVPVRDVPYNPTTGQEGMVLTLMEAANHLVEIWLHLGELPLEDKSALHGTSK